MRKELEPDWEIAEKLYPTIKNLIEKYAEYCDENDDEDLTEYKKLEDKLSKITEKDISKYNLQEWWEEEGLEVLAFRISLPAPKIVSDISREELLEIINQIKNSVEIDCDDSFKSDFIYYLSDYYHELLEMNFNK
jgi:Na+/phosphate symporter